MAINKKKQKQTIEMICDWVDQIDKSKRTGDMYREVLSSMTPEQFDAYMQTLKNGEDVLYILIPNLIKKGVSFENNLKVAKKMGVNFFKRLSIVDPKTGKRILTPKRYAIFDLPIRRQIQTIQSGLSVAANDSHIDPTTGQVIGESLAASISTPEIFVLYSRGLTKSISELTKVRGGDTKALHQTYRNLQQTGFATLEEAMNLDSRAVSTVTLSNMLKAMHIDNNL